MSETRLRLGETLVEAGVLTSEALGRALEIQKERQLRLGTILLQEGFVSESQLVQALSLKLSIPWVSLYHVDVPDELLEMVPVNVAEEFFLMPIHIRTTADGQKALYVAMNDPTDEDALRFVAATAGMPVKPMIAGPSDIAAAIRLYYYGEEEEDAPPEPSAPLTPPVPGAAPPPPPSSARGAPGPPLTKAAAEEAEEVEEVEALDEGDLVLHEEEAPPVENAEGTEDGEDVEGEALDEDKVYRDRTAAQREAERRLFGVGADKPKSGFSLTLLDGTTLSFGPGEKKPHGKGSLDSLSRQDLIAGLRAAAEGTPLDDFLPTDRWEAYMAALLEVLFRKHLVFSGEFIDELCKKGD